MQSRPTTQNMIERKPIVSPSPIISYPYGTSGTFRSIRSNCLDEPRVDAAQNGHLSTLVTGRRIHTDRSTIDSVADIYRIMSATTVKINASPTGQI